VVALTLVVATTAYGFAAANTVPASNAGDGSGTVSGYTVSSVHYTLNSTNPANVDSVSFTISPAVSAGGTVYVKLVNAGTTYASCSGIPGSSITCDVTGLSVTALAADQLRVIAAQ
jgi:hypothetical protein